MTITMEVGDIKRFASPERYASYCQCVKSQCTSNDKSKGHNNVKCGNKSLAWAYVEAANCPKRYKGPCRQFADRNTNKTNSTVATKAMDCKMSKAIWHVMSGGSAFDLNDSFRV